MTNINIGVSIITVIIGTFWGVTLKALQLPVSFGMSLLLPLCSGMKPETALIMLISVYCGASVSYPPNSKKHLKGFCVLIITVLSFIFLILFMMKFSFAIDKVQFLALSVFCITATICFQAYVISLSDFDNGKKKRALYPSFSPPLQRLLG